LLWFLKLHFYRSNKERDAAVKSLKEVIDNNGKKINPANLKNYHFDFETQKASVLRRQPIGRAFNSGISCHLYGKQ
jgi:hypothetical protein